MRTLAPIWHTSTQRTPTAPAADLLTGRERATAATTTTCPIRLANCSIHHGALHSQAKSSMLFSAHIWFPPATQWRRILSSSTHVPAHMHTLRPGCGADKGNPLALTSERGRTHARTRWPLCSPSQGCHWSSNTAEHQSGRRCLLVSFFFLPLAFCPHPLNISPAPWVFLQASALFWLSLQSIGHI